MSEKQKKEVARDPQDGAVESNSSIDQGGIKRQEFSEDGLKEESVENSKVASLVKPDLIENPTLMQISESASTLEKTVSNQLMRARESARSTTSNYVNPVSRVQPLSKASGNLHFVSDIPRLFSIEATLEASGDVGFEFNQSLFYVKESQKIFGTQNARVIVKLKSHGLKDSLDLDAVLRGFSTSGAPYSSIITRRTKMVEELFFLSYRIAISCDVICEAASETLKGPPPNVGDIIVSKGMLGNKYIPQVAPLLPAVTGLNLPRVLITRVCEMFEDPRWAMFFGERDPIQSYGVKIASTYGVFTDQWFSTLNRSYITYLESHRINRQTHIDNLQLFMFPKTQLVETVDSQVSQSTYPTFLGSECDGAVLLYVLSVTRQQQYLVSLRSLLQSTSFLTSMRVDEAWDLIKRERSLTDNTIASYFSSSARGVELTHVYDTLAASLSTMWVDVVIADDYQGEDLPTSYFQAFSACLWFLLYPEIAIDNADTLIYVLLRKLRKWLETETLLYDEEVGFTNECKGTMPRKVDHEGYLRGLAVINFMTSPIQSKKMKRLSELQSIIHRALSGSCTYVADPGSSYIPKLVDKRRYYQPYGFTPTTQYVTRLSGLLKELFTVFTNIFKTFQHQHRGDTSKSYTGDSRVSSYALDSIFSSGITPHFYIFAQSWHCEAFRLREYGASSPYHLDDDFTGSLRVRLHRPRVVITEKMGQKTVLASTRYLHSISFNVAWYTLIAVRGISATKIVDIQSPSPDDSYSYLRSIQVEGIAYGTALALAAEVINDQSSFFQKDLYITIGQYLTAPLYRAFVDRLLSLVGLRLGDAFTTAIAGTNQTVNVNFRGVSYAIELQHRNSMIVDAKRIPHTRYGDVLQLGESRVLTNIHMVYSLFTPQISPIELFNRGLLLCHSFSLTLDPNAYIYVPDIIMEYICLIWDPVMVGAQSSPSNFSMGHRVLKVRFRGPNGLMEEHSYTTADLNAMPKFMFIVCAGNRIHPDARDFLLPFFTRGKIAVLFLDMLVTRHITQLPDDATSEIDNQEQFMALFVADGNDTVHVNVGETRSDLVLRSLRNTKEKYFHFISPWSQRDVVLSGLRSDLLPNATDLVIGGPDMWCYGENGDSIHYEPDDSRLATLPPNMVGQGGSFRKMNLPFINFNNPVHNVTVRQIDPPKYQVFDDNLFQLLFRDEV